MRVLICLLLLCLLGGVVCAQIGSVLPLVNDRPFVGFQSGGNCVYVTKNVNFLAVVAVGPGGC